jgi:hypothetical protein
MAGHAVMLATQEVEIRKIMVQGQPGKKKFVRPLFQPVA